MVDILTNLENIDIDIDKAIMKNIDIDKEILENNDINKGSGNINHYYATLFASYFTIIMISIHIEQGYIRAGRSSQKYRRPQN